MRKLENFNAFKWTAKEKELIKIWKSKDEDMYTKAMSCCMDVNDAHIHATDSTYISAIMQLITLIGLFFLYRFEPSLKILSFIVSIAVVSSAIYTIVTAILRQSRFNKLKYNIIASMLLGILKIYNTENYIRFMDKEKLDNEISLLFHIVNRHYKYINKDVLEMLESTLMVIRKELDLLAIEKNLKGNIDG